MENLRNAAIAAIKDRFNNSRDKAKENITEWQKWHGKQYKKDALKMALKSIDLQETKEIKKLDDHLKAVSEAPDFGGSLILTVEWKKSYMWGMNPRVSTNYGFNGSSIGGCGYDKLSTATAEALNQDLRILKIMYRLKDKELQHRKPTYKEQNGEDTKEERGINQFLYGYGSGYSVLPRFEGGVGVSCHQHIIEKIGLKWVNLSSGKAFDVFEVTTK